jgi:hypothetical protein
MQKQGNETQDFDGIRGFYQAVNTTLRVDPDNDLAVIAKEMDEFSPLSIHA